MCGAVADRVKELLHRRAAPDHPVEFDLPREIGFGVQQPLAAVHARADAGQQSAQSAEVERFAL
jgi:hypothetical protein